MGIAVALLILAGAVTVVYPVVHRQHLAQPSVEMDEGEGKAWLDAQISIEMRGSISAGQIRESLSITPPVALRDEDVRVEHIARFPWHEGLPWSKTRVTLNASKSRLFEPETTYRLTLIDESIAFRTITVPKVVDARVESGGHDGFTNVPTSSPVVLVFNEEVVWNEAFLDLRPAAAVSTTARITSSGGTELRVIPMKRWENSTTYTLTISEGVTDRFGHESTQEFSLDFETWPPPVVVGAAPVGAHQPPDATVRVEFERPVNRRDVERAWRVEPAASGSFEWETDRLVTWRPQVLDYSTTYTVTAGGTSVDGDPIVPHEWNFTTQDPPIYVEIHADEESPTVLRAEVRGGRGAFSYQWSTGQAGEEIPVDLRYGETRAIQVWVASGDQMATTQVVVQGPPPPCPEGWTIVSEEVCYRDEMLPGPVRVFVARVELGDPDIQLRSSPAADILGQPRTVKESAATRDTILSINGDFFAKDRYFTLGPIISGGNLIYAPGRSHAVFALDRGLSSWVGLSNEFDIYLETPTGGGRRIDAVNDAPANDNLALFNAHWGSRLSLGLSGCYAVFAPADGAPTAAHQFSCGVIDGIPLRAGEYVLVGTGEAAEWLKRNVASPLSYKTSFPIPSVDFMVGGSHILIQNGELRELGSQSGGRHPRSAIGIDGEGYVYFVVADGRSRDSVGMTLIELQRYLSQFGIVNAVNLDGGGSSTMVLQGSTVNTPSDGRERDVAAVVEVTAQRGTCWHNLVRC